MGAEPPEVHLGGPHERAFEPLVAALDEVQRLLRGRRLVLVGGLGVAARLARPERATADLDHVVEAPRSGPGAVDLLVQAAPEVEVISAHRVTLGGVVVDLIDAPPADHDDPAFLPRGEALFQTAGRYALDTASAMRVTAGACTVDVAVATPAGLVATKLHAALHREENEERKKASDLFDLHRLLSQHDRRGELAATLARGRPPLPKLVAWAAREVFVGRVAELARLMRAHGDAVVASVEEVELVAVGEAFLAVLDAESRA